MAIPTAYPVTSSVDVFMKAANQAAMRAAFGAPGSNNAVMRNNGGVLGDSTTTLDSSGNLQVMGTPAFSTPMLRIGSAATGFAAIGNDTRLDAIINNAQNFTFGISNNNVYVPLNVQSIGFDASLITQDITLIKGGTGNLWQRAGTQAQVLSITNTFTSATSFEAFVVDWQSSVNVCRIGTIKGSGGGSVRNLDLIVDGVSRLTISPASGAVFSGNVQTSAGFISPGNFIFGPGPAAGTARLTNSTANGFTSFGFGLNTTSFTSIATVATNGLTLIGSMLGSPTVFNDASTAASGTAARRSVFSLAAPSFTSTNTGVTDTVAATLSIGGAPTAGTNTTITNAYALEVVGGTSYFGGTLNFQGITTISRSTTDTIIDTPGGRTQIRGNSSALYGGGVVGVLVNSNAEVDFVSAGVENITTESLSGYVELLVGGAPVKFAIVS